MAGVPLRERGSRAARRRLYAAAMTRRVYDALLDAAGYPHDHRARQIAPHWMDGIDLLLAMAGA